ncbi:MAG: peptide deformylase [Candidatus Kerfeldbacteria bacterium]|nr:peptide deformylase [Candidatus Kerfeldbacteria bacterium]
MLPLVIAPDPILRKVTEQVSLPLSAEVQALAKQMFPAMKHYDGIGLAAPQVGRSLQLMVVNTPLEPTAYVNPVILKRSWKKVAMEEGCLSIPGVFGIVKRPQKILARYVTLGGQTREEWLDGLMARVYQHEVDHLNGVLFIDKTKEITQGSELLAKYTQNEKIKM